MMRKMINTTKLKGFMGPFVQRRWLMRGDLISAEQLQNKMDTYMCAYFFFYHMRANKVSFNNLSVF